MLKKLASLLLSLLICLSLVSGQVHAIEPSEPDDVPVQEVFSDTKNTDDPDNSIMPAWINEFPDEEGEHQD